MKTLQKIVLSIGLIGLLTSCQSTNQVLSKSEKRMEIMNAIANDENMSKEMMGIMMGSKSGKMTMMKAHQAKMMEIMKEDPEMMKSMMSEMMMKNPEMMKGNRGKMMKEDPEMMKGMMMDNPEMKKMMMGHMMAMMRDNPEMMKSMMAEMMEAAKDDKAMMSEMCKAMMGNGKMMDMMQNMKDDKMDMDKMKTKPVKEEEHKSHH